MAFRTAEDRVRVVCGAERRRRPATERGAVRCAGGWRADAWGAGGSVRVAGKLEGSFADKSIGNDEPLACCVGVGRNTQSAGDNAPLDCRSLQVVSYVRDSDSGFAVRIKGGVRINCDGNHNEPLVCRPDHLW